MIILAFIVTFVSIIAISFCYRRVFEIFWRLKRQIGRQSLNNVRGTDGLSDRSTSKYRKSVFAIL